MFEYSNYLCLNCLLFEKFKLDYRTFILGCATRFKIEDGLEWVPTIAHATEYDSSFGVDVGTVYVSLGKQKWIKLVANHSILPHMVSIL